MIQISDLDICIMEHYIIPYFGVFSDHQYTSISSYLTNDCQGFRFKKVLLHTSRICGVWAVHIYFGTHINKLPHSCTCCFTRPTDVGCVKLAERKLKNWKLNLFTLSQDGVESENIRNTRSRNTPRLMPHQEEVSDPILTLKHLGVFKNVSIPQPWTCQDATLKHYRKWEVMKCEGGGKYR